MRTSNLNTRFSFNDEQKASVPIHVQKQSTAKKKELIRIASTIRPSLIIQTVEVDEDKENAHLSRSYEIYFMLSIIIGTLFSFFSFTLHLAFDYHRDVKNYGESPPRYGWSIIAVLVDLLFMISFLRDTRKEHQNLKIQDISILQEQILHNSTDNFMRPSSYSSRVVQLFSICPIGLATILFENSIALPVLMIAMFGRISKCSWVLEGLMKIIIQRYDSVKVVNQAGIFSVLKLILIFPFFAHFFACGFIYIGHRKCGLTLDLCVENSASWVVQDQLKFSTNGFRTYSRALYFATLSLLTIGYGDIIPGTFDEILFVLCIEVVASVFTTASIAHFAFIFHSIYSRSSALSSSIEIIKKYMESHNLPKELQHDVILYFDYLKSFSMGYNEEQLIDDLPEHLQIRLKSEIGGLFLNNLHFLDSQPRCLIQSLLISLKSRFFCPGDYIIKSSTIMEMYYIRRGRLYLIPFYGGTEANKQILKSGVYFAELCLFENNVFMDKVVACTYSELLVLERDSLKTCIRKHHPSKLDEIFQNFHHITKRHLKQAEKMKRILGKTENREAKIPMSWKLPGSVLRKFWDFVRLLLITKVIFYGPVHLVNFDLSNDAVEIDLLGYSTIFEFCEIIFFCLDLYLRSRYFAFTDVALTGSTTPVTDPEFIFEYYQQRGFFQDLISYIPLNYIFNTLSLYPSKIFLLHSFLKILRVGDLLESVFIAFTVGGFLKKLIRVVLGAICSIHWIGCFWFFASTLSYQSKESIDNRLNKIDPSLCIRDVILHNNCTWIHFDMIYNREPSFIYLRSVYWSAMAFTTTAYGDIRAFSTLESWFVLVFTFFGCIAHYMVVGAVASLTQQISANERTFKSKLQQVNRWLYYVLFEVILPYSFRFILRKHLPKSIMTSVNTYFQYQWLQHRGVSEASILQILPDKLQEKISEFIHKTKITELTIFNGCTDEFIIAISSKLTQEIFTTGDYVAHAGDPYDKFWRIARGRVEFFHKSTPMPIMALEEGTFFGEKALIYDGIHKQSVVACCFTDLSVLSKSDYSFIANTFCDDAVIVQMNTVRSVQLLDNLERAITRNFSRKSSIITKFKDVNTLFVAQKIPSSIILPNSSFKKFWDSMLLLIIIYCCFGIVFRISFASTAQLNTVNVYDILVDIILLADIYLNYNHFAYIEENGEVQTQGEEICKHYKRTDFVFDLVASAPHIWTISPVAIRLFRLVRLRQLKSKFNVIQIFLFDRFFSPKLGSILTLLKEFFLIIFFTHYAGSIFYFIGKLSQKESYANWIDNDILLRDGNASISINYIRSIYWATSSVTLVVLGDIVPHSAPETIWTIFCCLVSVFVMSILIGSFTQLIRHMDIDALVIEDKRKKFAEFASSRKIKFSTIQCANQFYNFQLEETGGLDDKIIFDYLPSNFVSNITKHLYAHIMLNTYVFAEFTPQNLSILLRNLKMEMYLPNEFVFRRGCLGEKVFFLKKGLASVILSTHSVEVIYLYAGSIFGEIAFFLHPRRRMASVFTKTMCEVYSFNKEVWNLLLKSNKGGTVFDIVKERVKSRLDMYLSGHRVILNNVQLILRSNSVSTLMKSIVTSSTSAKRTSVAISDFRRSSGLVELDYKKVAENWKFPDSKFRLAWLTIMVIIIAFYVSIVPFRICFINLDPQTYEHIIFSEGVADFFVLLHILMKSFFFCIVLEGKTIDDQSTFFQHYYHHGFTTDVIALIPAQLIIPQASYLRIISLNKLLLWNGFSNKISQIETILASKWNIYVNESTRHFSKIFAIIIICAHYISCIWYLTGLLTFEEPSWLSKPHIVDFGCSARSKAPNILQCYFLSLYFALSALTSTGYGDIVSSNLTETVVVMGILGVTLSLISMLVGAQDIFIQNRIIARYNFEENLKSIEGYAKFNHISEELSNDIRTFCENRWQRYKGIGESADIDNLPTSIREQVGVSLRKEIYRIFRIFASADQDIVTEILLALKAEIFAAHYIIIHEGDVGRDMYFVNKGAVHEVFPSDDNEREVEAKNPGDYFGEEALVYDIPYTADYITMLLSELYILSHKNFLGICKKFPSDCEEVLISALHIEKTRNLSYEFY